MAMRMLLWVHDTVCTQERRGGGVNVGCEVWCLERTRGERRGRAGEKRGHAEKQSGGKEKLIDLFYFYTAPLLPVFENTTIECLPTTSQTQRKGM